MKRVLMAMSGGIDSTVAAILLHKQGYEVIGITMKTWDYSTAKVQGKETGCCNLNSFNDARQVAVDFGFPHYIFDIRKEFTTAVIDNFIDEYLNGRTPNPCIMCNTHIKWNVLLKKADELNCSYIATGHYAQISKMNDRWVISKGLDENKDQSYVLWGLSQEVIKRTLFPIGQYKKQQIRQMAFDWGYEELSKKKESYDICFIPNNDYRQFIAHNQPDKIQGLNHGSFVNKEGLKLGEHQGYPFFTIGQRKGIQVSNSRPYYVIQIIPEKNWVVLGTEEDLAEKTISVAKTNFIKFPKIVDGLKVNTKIRYKDPGTASHLFDENNGIIRVVFSESVKGVAPGQSAVFYQNEFVVGGGIINKKS